MRLEGNCGGELYIVARGGMPTKFRLSNEEEVLLILVLMLGCGLKFRGGNSGESDIASSTNTILSSA